jgi:hypothetical protein
VAPDSTQDRQRNYTVQPLDQGPGGFVLSAPTRANEHRGPLKVHVVPVDPSRAMVAITWESIGRDLYDLVGAKPPGHLSGGEKAPGPDDQGGELLRAAVLIGKAGCAIELKREPSPAAGQLPLSEVLVREALGPGREIGKAWVGVQITASAIGVLRGTLGAAVLVKILRLPTADHVPALGKKVVDRLLGLGSAEVDEATPGLEDGVDLFDLLRELIALELGVGAVRYFEAVHD